MSDLEIRVLGEEEWETFREVRLRALRQDPRAFAATVEEEVAMTEEEWRARMLRSSRMIASLDDEIIGVVSLRVEPGPPSGDELDDLEPAEVFGLWVAPEHRGRGTPSQLIDAAADRARAYGSTHLVYWVGIDNARAVAFASGYGFRPTDSRREARAGGEEGFEAAMIFPLAR